MAITKREYRDLLIKTSLEGGFPSIRVYVSEPISGNGCMYRNAQGKKCAFGLLIPDDRYSPQMEGRLINLLINGLADCIPEGLSINDLTSIQAVHDDIAQAMGYGNGPNGWDHDRFVKRLNGLYCFREFCEEINT